MQDASPIAMIHGQELEPRYTLVEDSFSFMHLSLLKSRT